jgi:hypothetical protein
LVAIVASELQTEVEYDVAVSGAVNINGVRDGGGETSLLLRAPEPAPDGGGPPGTVLPDSIPPGGAQPGDLQPDTIPIPAPTPTPGGGS